MTQVCPSLGLAPVPTVVSMNFSPVWVVMVFPWGCAAAGQAAATVAVAVASRTRRVTRMVKVLARPTRYHAASR
jgi:hypothetical protein